MLDKLLDIRMLMFAAIASLGFSVTGCDFGNKTKTLDEAHTDEGIIQEGDNIDDNAQADTAALDSFR